jgi:TP901 family phage tail tape measure protein
MTAIWNNFYDGSKSLEYYADVMAKLGAETAASTDDIAAGLQKFAPIAKTVGLSYETAASMIATVVDKTQQSADVVGTAFRNVFTRIQGLKLGETLEDGVDLNKYSEGLKKVGVDVLDANDKLKDLDEILPELANKWQTLDKAQKAALAQTVAGTRQYSQFMAVMENWEDVEMNVEVAVDSEGTIKEQYDKWADSFAGASDRMKNSL